MKITAKDILKHSPCEEWTEERLEKKLGKGKTLLEILSMRSVAYNNRIWWVTKFLPDNVNRRFAIWCARQCKIDVKEIADYIDAIEAYYFSKGTKRVVEEASRAAYCAADNAVYSAAYRAAYWAAYFAADSAAYNASYWAACWAADSDKMEKNQIKKLKELIKNEVGLR